MKHKIVFLLFLLGFAMHGCIEESFEEVSSEISPREPSDLKYVSLINGREKEILVTSPPTYNSYGAIPTFEIVDVRNEAGESLSMDTIAAYFSIKNTALDSISVDDEFAYINSDGDSSTVHYVLDQRNIGQITISNGNSLTEGNYSFDVRMTTTFGEETFSKSFENVFELYMGPGLASGLVYIPGGQNLLTTGGGGSTSEPIVFGANPDFRFELVDYADTLVIDSSTGAISLASGFSSSVDSIVISPTINLVSNISDEGVSFSDVVQIYISSDSVIIPKLRTEVFYPTLEDENTQYGYRIHTVKQGDDGIFWANLAPGISLDDRPEGNVNQKRLEINLVKPSPGEQVGHESWAIMNSQDLSAYGLGFDVETEFYSENRFIEYLSIDGTSPSLFEVYISTDYLGDFATATWTEVTDQLKSNIATTTGGGNFLETSEFTGYPYPGDQQLRDLPNPEDQKNAMFNADDRWVRSTFDMVDYLGQTNVTVAFRVYTTFSGTLDYAFPFDRSGRFILGDFNIVANEQ